MKRFYAEVAVGPTDGGAWRLLLDGRPIRTQLGAPQEVPTSALAEMLAGEWRKQGEEIDPASFVWRDMADYAIDVIAGDRADTIASLIGYSQTDTLCHRADPADALFARQEELWEPLVCACEAKHGLRLPRVSGIVHQSQPPETTERIATLLEEKDEFVLAALQTLTALSASLVVGLAALEDGADPEALFAASNCEQDWQAELWGWDSEAEKARDMRQQAFTMAMEFAHAAQATG